MLRVSTLNFKLFGEDIGQLGSKPISTSGHFLHSVVIIATGKQMSKYKSGHVTVLLGMHDYWYSLPIVPNLDGSLALVNGYFDLCAAFFIPLNIVSRIYNDFVKNLEEAWNVGDLLLNELVYFHNPH